MTEKNNKAKSLDFAPDLSVAKENLKGKKTTIILDDDELIAYIQDKKSQGFCVSKYVSSLIRQDKEISSAISRTKYGVIPSDYIPFTMLLPVPVAKLFDLLAMNCGEIPLANRLISLIAGDTTGLLMNDCNTYSSREHMLKCLGMITRAVERIKNSGVNNPCFLFYPPSCAF